MGLQHANGLNLFKAKRQNDIAIKQILYKYAPITRNRIASMLGLSVPTITTNIADLIQKGIVHEVEASEEQGVSVGRKARAVDLVSDYSYFIGIEITPVRCVFCLSDLRLEQIWINEEVRDNHDYDEVVIFVAQKIEELLAAHPDVRHLIQGIGVGVPGFVESKSGVIRVMGRFDWHNKPLAQDLSSRVGLPVRIENNVRVRVIGEDMKNGRYRPETFAYLFVSLGIACPLMIKDDVLTGRSAGAGEIGHMIMRSDGPVCKMCGKRGCLDSIASETAVLAACREALTAGRAAELARIIAQRGQLTMGEVVLAQEAGDSDVQKIVQEAIHYLAIAMANVTNFINPNLVLVDAYLMKLAENREQFLTTIHKYLFGVNDKEVTVEFKEKDKLSGCKGAVMFAIKEFLINSESEMDE